MTFTISYTEGDIYNMAKLAAEIEPSSMTKVFEMFDHDYTIIFKHMNMSISKKRVINLHISSEFFSYLADNMLDIISMSKMIWRVFMRMFGDNFNAFVGDNPTIIIDGKNISDSESEK